jgi:hypothetical protein
MLFKSLATALLLVRRRRATGGASSFACGFVTARDAPPVAVGTDSTYWLMEGGGGGGGSSASAEPAAVSPRATAPMAPRNGRNDPIATAVA